MIKNSNVQQEKKQTSQYKKYKTILPMCCGFSILLLFFTICCILVNNYTAIANESIILTFIGALATFVVVGNYMQTRDIKEGMKEEISQTKSEMSCATDTVKEDLKYEMAELKNEIKGEITKIDEKHRTITIAMAERSRGDFFLQSNRQWSLLHYISSLKMFNQINEPQFVDIIMFSIHALAREDKYIKKEIKLSSNQKSDCIEVLSHSNHMLAKEIILYIENVPEDHPEHPEGLKLYL